MADSAKSLPVGGGSLVFDLKALSPFFRTRRTVTFAYGFMFAFLAFTLFLVFTSSSNSAFPLFPSIFSSPSPSASASASGTGGAAAYPYTSHFHSFYYYFFPAGQTYARESPRLQSTQPLHKDAVPPPLFRLPPARPRSDDPALRSPPVNEQPSVSKTSVAGHARAQKPNRTTTRQPPATAPGENTLISSSPLKPSSPATGYPRDEVKAVPPKSVVSDLHGNPTKSITVEKRNRSSIAAPATGPPGNAASNSPAKSKPRESEKGTVSNLTDSSKKRRDEDKGLLKSLMKCDFYDGEWVRDDSYPLYKPGSCLLIDEQFNCLRNGRPDQAFQKLKWKPKGCTLPRLDGRRMLDLLRGKRLVFVGDSLNRNMWESLVCILRNSAKDQSKVFEAAGRQYFRTDASYSFLFQDYNCSVEFFVTPFLVQEWEASDKNGTKKETLRLDLVERSSVDFKGADFIIFNTGHWWTHEKTSTGKDYYQEGSHVYEELNVLEAFRKALTTWGRWIDANVNPARSQVFFRGYSASHFSGGQWNSGGQCDHETEPIKEETYLSEYPDKMQMLERVLKGMRTGVVYMNVTRMSDYRKDGHPSVFRKPNQSVEEMQAQSSIQDCSHWCLPGVPDTWNEILYAEILRSRLHRKKLV